MDRYGFTLAETLITLGIVGIIAAIIIPTLVANYQKKITVTQLKKAYSVTQQAIKLSENDNGSIKLWDTKINGHNFFNRYIKGYLKSTKEYSTSELWKIAPHMNLNNEYYYGTTYRGNNSTHVLLEDGTMVSLNLNSGSESGLWVGIDINGLKEPNKIGKDTFLFFFSTQYGLQPLGGEGTGNAWSYGEYTRDKILGNNTNACNKTKTGYWCSALIINDNWEIKQGYPW